MMGRLRLRLERAAGSAASRRSPGRDAAAPCPGAGPERDRGQAPGSPVSGGDLCSEGGSASDPDCSREELLRQAREAARAETGSVLPPGARLPLWPAVLLLLGALAILKFTGVI